MIQKNKENKELNILKQTIKQCPVGQLLSNYALRQHFLDILNDEAKIKQITKKYICNNMDKILSKYENTDKIDTKSIKEPNKDDFTLNILQKLPNYNQNMLFQFFQNIKQSQINRKIISKQLNQQIKEQWTQDRYIDHQALINKKKQPLLNEYTLNAQLIVDNYNTMNQETIYVSQNNKNQFTVSTSVILLQGNNISQKFQNQIILLTKSMDHFIGNDNRQERLSPSLKQMKKQNQTTQQDKKKVYLNVCCAKYKEYMKKILKINKNFDLLSEQSNQVQSKQFKKLKAVALRLHRYLLYSYYLQPNKGTEYLGKLKNKKLKPYGFFRKDQNKKTNIENKKKMMFYLIQKLIQVEHHQSPQQQNQCKEFLKKLPFYQKFSKYGFNQQQFQYDDQEKFKECQQKYIESYFDEEKQKQNKQEIVISDN